MTTARKGESASGTRKPSGSSTGQRQRADATPLPLWLIESSGKAPQIVTTQTGSEGIRVTPYPLPRGEHALVLETVSSRTIGQRFGIAVVSPHDDPHSPITASDGTAQRMIVKFGTDTVPNSVVFEGTIEAISTYRMHEIDHSRTLKAAEWSHYVRFRSTNKNGIARETDVAMMQLRDQQKNMTFIDALGLTTVARTTDIVAYMRIIADRLPDNGIAIAGQGPVILPDNSRAFVCQSGVFDEHGQLRPEIIVDASGIPHKFRYYDVTPASELDSALVQAGIKDLLRSYNEIPEHPEIPAAFLATVFTAPIATLDPDFFIATFLYGMPGSGKSRLSRRMDAIQSRTIRNHSSAKPVLNLGTTTGTIKGSVYRVTEYGGFAITCDDVNKAGDSSHQVDAAKTAVSNLLRSHENGGGALGRVNRAKNRVESGQSGELHSNIRFTSEKPIPGSSTLDRMIMLPPLTDTWEAGPFDRDTSEYLWTPESLERQAQAVSALTHWVFSQLASIDDYLAKARQITRQWSVSARTADRYAAAIAAHLIFQAFAGDHNIDASSAVETATKALRLCAERQTLSKLSPAYVFRSRLRLAIDVGVLSFTGRPLVNKTGEVIREYTTPFIYVPQPPDESGVVENTEHRPPYIDRLSQLGLIRKGKNVGVLAGAPFGYVIPPSDGKHKSDYATKWQLALTNEQLERLADALTRYSRDKDGHAFTVDSIRELITTSQVGQKIKRRLYVDENGSEFSKKSPQAVTIIDMGWLFEPLTDETEED